MDTVFFLEKRHVKIPAGKTFLKQEEYGYLIEANTILEQARQKASETIAQANEIYEARKKQGYEDGMKQGQLEHTEKIIDISLKTVEYFKSIEKSIAGVVSQCLEKIIGEMDKEELILRVVKSGLAVARNEHRVTVRVSPEDIGSVKNATAELLQSYPLINTLDITEDSRLKRGACLVESELGVVDAGVETQLEAIKKAISKRI